ncbi:MAG: pilus assembly protein PilM, partial [Candidatus Omnitrophica bacterium]|nr:pilus assembly protein PilM [Candidatus Omnitrophota bacterium]
DIGTASLKLCLMTGAGSKRQIAFLASRPLTGLTDDDIAKTLVILLRDLKIKHCGFGLFVPSQMVITKTIEVPSVDPKEIREIVNLQAGRHTPHAREEVIIDYIVQGTLKQSYTKVLLLIVASNAVKRQFAILDKAGIVASRALLAQEGVAAFAGRYLKPETAAPTGIIHIDDSCADFSVIFKGKVLFVRSIPVGSTVLLAEGEKASERFAEEIKKSLEAYAAESVDKSPTLLLLVGAIQGLEGLDTVLHESTQIPVRVAQYLGVVPKTARAQEAAGASPAVSYFAAIAGLVALADCKTNLIPEDIKLRFALAVRGRQLMRTSVAVFTLMFFLFLTMVSTVYFKQEYLSRLRGKYTKERSDARVLEEILRKNRLVRSYVNSRGTSVAVLAELHALTPLTVELNYIKYEGEGRLVMRGTADSMTQAFAFGDTLGKSKLFKEVKTKYATKRQEGKREVADFEINCAVTKVLE